MNKKRLLLLGGGGHCKSVIDVIEKTEAFEIVGIIDVAEKIGQEILGYPIIGTEEQIESLQDQFDGIHLSFGKMDTSGRRSGVFRKMLEKRYHFPIIISPLAYVSRHAFIGEGTIVMHQALINAGAHVGRNCIINTKSLIEHDAVVGDHCHIATGAIINGGVEVGSESFIGSGSVSKQNSVIPFGSFIKANSIIK